MLEVSRGIAVVALLSIPASQPAASVPEGLQPAVDRVDRALEKGDRNQLAALLDGRLTWITAAGHLLAKDQVAGAATPVNRSLESRDVRPLGSHAAVVISLNKVGDAEWRSVDFWTEASGHWLLAGHQSVQVHGSPTNGDKAPSGRTPESFGSQADRESLVRALEQSNEAARAHDAPRWRNLITKDYLSIGSNGEQRSAAELADDVDDGDIPPLPSLAESSVRVYGDAAIVTSKTVPQEEHPEQRFERVTRVYVRQDGRWLRAAAIVTKVSDES